MNGSLAAILAEGSVCRSVQTCTNEKDVRDCAQWVYSFLGQNLDPAANHQRAMQLGEAMIGMPCEAYQARAIAWWRAVPLTVQLIRKERASLGTAIILPLTAETYERIRAGKQYGSLVRPDELNFLPSRAPLYRSGWLTDFAAIDRPRWRYYPLPEKFAVDMQIAALCTSSNRLSEPLRFLTRIGIPLGEVSQRL